MSNVFLWFWTAMIFASVFWYGFLLFYVGFKGGRELVAMTRAFRQRETDGPQR